MPSNPAVVPLEHILSAIDRIQGFTAGMDYADYQEDERTRLAVERLLQILTEAGHRLGRQAPQICPEIKWRDIRSMGNVLRHDYDEITDEEIWRTVTVDLPVIETAVRTAYDRLSEEPGDILK